MEQGLFVILWRTIYEGKYTKILDKIWIYRYNKTYDMQQLLQYNKGVCYTMPPKVKFSREEILNVALDIVRENGVEALTARALGKRLGTSARPIFTAFENMDELQEELKKSAEKLYEKYVREGLADQSVPAFKSVAKQYLLFAKNEPKLFRLLFMSGVMLDENIKYNPIISENYKFVYAAFRSTYSLSEEQTGKLFLHVGIYLHGLATLYVEKMCDFPIEYAGELMLEMGASLLHTMKEH